MIEENVIKIESNITYEDYKKINWFMMFKKGKGYKTSIKVSIVSYIIVIVLVLFWRDVFNPFWTWLLYLAAAPFALGYVFKNAIQRAYQKSPFISGSIWRFEFSSEIVKEETIAENIVKDNTVYKYDAFTRICELKDAFYLFLGENQFYVIAKRNVDSQTVDRLRKLFKEKMKERFVSCLKIM